VKVTRAVALRLLTVAVTAATLATVESSVAVTTPPMGRRCKLGDAA
jgi:hypothetical protein